MQEDTDKTLQPTWIFNMDDIIVHSYAPDKIRVNGVCLALGLMFALYSSQSYQFDYLMIRRSKNQILKEPLIYKDARKLIMKEVCQDIETYMNGDFESVYVQITVPETDIHIGGTFWNLDRNFRSFSVAYYVTDTVDTQHISKFITQVYDTFVHNYETIMRKMELPAAV